MAIFKVAKKHLTKSLQILCTPTKGEGGHISVSADLGRRRDSLVSTISLESIGGILPDLHGYIIGTSQRADYILVTLTPFSRSQEA